MEQRIRDLATVSVMRGAGFVCLGIVMAMSGLAFDPALSFRFGSVSMLGLAGLMQVKALSYHRVRRIRETEVWVMLRDSERPTEEVARPLIVAAMSAELQQKAVWSAVVAAVFLAASVGFRRLT